MSNADLYGHVTDGAVADGPRTLPTSWRTDDAEILAFDRLDDPTPYGWWPWVEEEAPAFDPAKQRIEPAVRLDAKAKRIVRGYGVVDLSAEEIAAADPVPEVISDRQFAQVLALDGVISQDEALAWAARGDLPQRLTDALTKIPEDGGQRFGARMMLAAATTYERHHPLVPTLGGLLGMDAPALDQIWRAGATL